MFQIVVFFRDSFGDITSRRSERPTRELAIEEADLSVTRPGMFASVTDADGQSVYYTDFELVTL